MNIEKTIKNLTLRGFSVKYFDNKEAASEYICENVKNTQVGIGGCMTIKEMGLSDKLRQCGNEVFWHWENPGYDTLVKANSAPVYLCSANAISEDGEILNIDGNGNRLAATSFGKKRVFLVCGTNKIEEDFQAALNRARNIAAVTNLKRFEDMKTPCKLDGVCHDCRVSNRGCKGLLVLWGPTNMMESFEVILINEELGY